MSQERADGATGGQAAPLWVRVTRLARTPAGIALGVVLYALLWAATSFLPVKPSDLDAFFLPGAFQALNGHPLHLYAVRYQLVYPLANGPLGLVPLVPAAAVVRALGWQQQLALRRAVIMALYSVFSLLMARETVLGVELVTGRRLAAGLRALTFGVVAFTPLLWHSVLFYGHVEQPILLWLTLAGVRALGERRPLKAGVLLGLALLTRSTAALVLLPLALILLYRRKWRAAVAMSVTAGIVVGLGLLPFLVADTHDVIFSLLTFHKALPVAGGNIWGVVQGTALQSFAMTHDTQVVIAAAILITLIALCLRPSLKVASRETYAVLALANLCFALFIKTVWPYYFLETYVYVAVWTMLGLANASARVERARFWRLRATFVALAPLAGLVVIAQINEHGILAAHQTTVSFTWSLATCLGVLLLMLPLWRSLLARPTAYLLAAPEAPEPPEPLLPETPIGEPDAV